MPDVRSLLSDSELATLRGGYDARVLLAVSTQRVAELYDPAAPLMTGFFPETLYADAPVAPRDRERCLITLLASRPDAMPLAVHCYWGLMEGLSVEEVAHTLLLTGMYNGIPTYTTAMRVFMETCGALSTLANFGGETVKTPMVLQKLLEIFP